MSDPGGSRAQCSICQHPDRQAIDQALVNARSKKATAERFGVSYDAIKRHAKHHLEPLVREAVAEQKAAIVAGLVDRINKMDLVLDGVLERALNPEPETITLDNGDTITRTPPINERVVLAAVRRAQTQAELVARFIGASDPDPESADLARQVLRSPEAMRAAAELEEALARQDRDAADR